MIEQFGSSHSSHSTHEVEVPDLCRLQGTETKVLSAIRSCLIITFLFFISLCNCSENPFSSSIIGGINLAVSIKDSSAAGLDKIQKVNRLEARVSQGEKEVKKQDEFERERDQWRSKLTLEAGSYEVVVNAYVGTMIEYRGSTRVNVRQKEIQSISIQLKPVLPMPPEHPPSL